MLLGCIGDDFTGSSDLANTLAKQGMRTVQYSGVPTLAAVQDVEAGVVALKTRTIDVDEAIALSLQALAWLQEQGCEQYFFKYCSTFDSTADGNIGPVADALAEQLDAHQVIVCPAFPRTGRSLYQGHLFVNDVLLNESGMQHHPLTPMTDSDIRRWLKLQSRYDVGHVPAHTVFAGADAVAYSLQAEHDANKRHIVVDAIRDEDLMVIGEAARSLKLITGGSGVAMGLPANFQATGRITGGVDSWTGDTGRCIALSGSCSNATRTQIERHASSFPTREATPGAIINGDLFASDAVEWLLSHADTVPLLYSSATPELVEAAQNQYGREATSGVLEGFFADVARLAVQSGVTRLIVAGGETSGAIVEALDVESLAVGPEIDPGVPAMRAQPDLVVALKSGNFGAPDFFAKAAAVLSA